MANELKFSKADLRKELLLRKQKQVDKLQEEYSPNKELGLWRFCQHIAPDFYTDDKTPLRELTEVFRRITLGELQYVLISMFPRMGKSRTTTYWIGWWLGYDPQGSFMRNCYNDELAMTLSKATLDLLTSSEYGEIFPDIKLDNSAHSKMNWQIKGTTITTYFGGGINGTMTGKGCNRAAIFDDPVKNPEEAMSETHLEKVDTIVEYALTSRVETASKCARVIIQTRWASKDPIGLRENDPKWSKFIFPLLDENDKSICESMFPTKDALEIRASWKATGKEWMFEALYQCKPIDASFAKISLDDLNLFSMKDLDDIEIEGSYAWCDYANKGSDNLSAPFAKTSEGRVFITGVVFSSEDSINLQRPLIEKTAQFKPDEFVFESNAGGMEFATNLEEKYKKLFEALGVEIECRTATTNKEIRILLSIGDIKARCYFLVENERDEDYKRFVSNLVSYGKHRTAKDDAIDSMAGLLSLLSSGSELEIDIITNSKKSFDNNDNSVLGELSYDEESEIVIF